MAVKTDVVGYLGGGKWALNYGCYSTKAKNLCDLGRNQLAWYKDGLDLYFHAFYLKTITSTRVAEAYIMAELVNRDIPVTSVKVFELPDVERGSAKVEIEVKHEFGDAKRG